MEKLIRAKVLVPGTASAQALVAQTPLSLWGGLDPHTGEIIDKRHDLAGENAKDKVLVLPLGKGSSTASAILLEAIRAGAAPAAIITRDIDPIIALGAIVGDEMYSRTIPVLVIEGDDYGLIHTGDTIHIENDGTVKITGNRLDLSL